MTFNASFRRYLIEHGSKFVNVSGEIEEPQAAPMGHSRSYSRAASVGLMTDHKALALLGEMGKVCHDVISRNCSLQ
jgi:hypothetical protein